MILANWSNKIVRLPLAFILHSSSLFSPLCHYPNLCPKKNDYFWGKNKNNLQLFWQHHNIITFLLLHLLPSSLILIIIYYINEIFDQFKDYYILYTKILWSDTIKTRERKKIAMIWSIMSLNIVSSFLRWSTSNILSIDNYYEINISF